MPFKTIQLTSILTIKATPPPREHRSRLKMLWAGEITSVSAIAPVSHVSVTANMGGSFSTRTSSNSAILLEMFLASSKTKRASSRRCHFLDAVLFPLVSGLNVVVQIVPRQYIVINAHPIIVQGDPAGLLPVQLTMNPQFAPLFDCTFTIILADSDRRAFQFTRIVVIVDI